ncbi:hypothetical protein ABBQ32_011220 [Trebouxia sp. C0010 RCD-2024]
MGLLLDQMNPVIVRQITVKDFHRFRDRYIPPLDNPVFQTGLRTATQTSMLIAKGHLWGSLRAGAQPMFHSNHLSQYSGIINTAVDGLIGTLSAIAKSGKEVEIMQHLGQMTMQVTGAAAFGVDLHAQRGVSEADAELTTAVKTVFASSAPSFWFLLAMLVPAPLQPLIKALSARFPDEKLSALHKAYEVVYDVSATLIENSKRKLQGKDVAPSDWTWFERDAGSPYKDVVPDGTSIIPTLLHANNKATGTPLSDLQIAAQVTTFMLAGYETTSVALTYCIYFLSKHPDAQSKLLEEVDQFQGKPSYEDLGRFPYASGVLNEAMRILPPAPLFARIAQEDVQIGSFAVPKGTPVQIGVYAMHHDERWWQDAEQFKPERWLGDKTGGDRSGGLAYLPFGAGPRMCIGIKLAVEEATIALIRLYQQFTFQLSENCVEPLDLKQAITMSPKGGVPVYVTKRAQA